MTTPTPDAIRRALESAGVHPTDATRAAHDLADRSADRELMRKFTRQLFNKNEEND